MEMVKMIIEQKIKDLQNEHQDLMDEIRSRQERSKVVYAVTEELLGWIDEINEAAAKYASVKKTRAPKIRYNEERCTNCGKIFDKSEGICPDCNDDPEYDPDPIKKDQFTPEYLASLPISELKSMVKGKVNVSIHMLTDIQYFRLISAFHKENNISFTQDKIRDAIKAEMNKPKDDDRFDDEDLMKSGINPAYVDLPAKKSKSIKKKCGVCGGYHYPSEDCLGDNDEDLIEDATCEMCRMIYKSNHLVCPNCGSNEIRVKDGE